MALFKGNVTIKDIPSSEEYLFAEKVNLATRSLFFIPNAQRVKLIITNVALYVKIANVLIDLSGTERMRIDEIRTMKAKKKHQNRKWRTLEICDPFSIYTFGVTKEQFEKIIQILLSANPNIIYTEV
ncbi:MAG: hypothetical protein IJX30_00515 [Clostridia bacterium]|nr:hypothetical protein [Clostridia bacterium]